MFNSPKDIRPKSLQTMTSAKKAKDGIGNLLQVLMSNLGNETSQGNASTIYNLVKLFL